MSPTAPGWLDLNRQTDEELAASFLAGHKDAVAVLFDRYHRLVYSVALRILRDTGESEDVVQNVFLDICRAMANFDSAKGTLKVWLLQYAYHRALHRKRHLQANHFYQWVELEGAGKNLRISANLDNAIEQRQLIDTWLGKLNPERRKILILAYCEGLTADEIALRLHRSVHVIRHEMYRSLSYLRKEITRQRTSQQQSQTEMAGAQRRDAQTI